MTAYQMLGMGMRVEGLGAIGRGVYGRPGGERGVRWLRPER